MRVRRVKEVNPSNPQMTERPESDSDSDSMPPLVEPSTPPLEEDQRQEHKTSSSEGSGESGAKSSIDDHRALIEEFQDLHPYRGFKTAGNVIGIHIHHERVTSHNLRAVTDLAQKAFGGEVACPRWPAGGEISPSDYYQQHLRYSNVGKLEIALTKRASRSKKHSYNILGPRLYFRGFAEQVRDRSDVVQFLETIAGFVQRGFPGEVFESPLEEVD